MIRKEKMSLGEKLRELRETYDLSQNQVASALNIDRSTYSNYELDKTHPSLEALVRLARIFNVPKESLLPEDDNDTVTFRDIVRPYSMVQSLNKEERGLLAMYRSLSGEQKEELMKTLSAIAGAEKEEE